MQSQINTSNLSISYHTIKKYITDLLLNFPNSYCHCIVTLVPKSPQALYL